MEGRKARRAGSLRCQQDRELRGNHGNGPLERDSEHDPQQRRKDAAPTRRHFQIPFAQGTTHLEAFVMFMGEPLQVLPACLSASCSPRYSGEIIQQSFELRRKGTNEPLSSLTRVPVFHFCRVPQAPERYVSLGSVADFLETRRLIGPQVLLQRPSPRAVAVAVLAPLAFPFTLWALFSLCDHL